MADRLELQRIASAFRMVGWGAFWSQLTLALVSGGVLAFNSIGSELVNNRDKAIGLGPGLSLTTLALLVLAWSVWQDWGLVRLSRVLGSGSSVIPSKGETRAQVKRHLLASLVGLTLAAIGYQALSGSLTFQASLQQPGVVGAVGMGNNAITSLEMFSVMANTQALSGHLIGLWVSLWLLQRLARR
ncbi:MAG: DUF3611 family protein [Synechococcus sp.]|nr:DUF3611 family protein [Synechococcus sp.]